MKIQPVQNLLQEGVREGIFPGAVLLIACRGDLLFHGAAGHRRLIPQSDPMNTDTILDLASLTKPLATTLALMKLFDSDVLELDRPLGEVLPNEIPEEKARLTPRMLLSHCAGFPDWKPYFRKLVRYKAEKRKAFLRKWILEEPLVYAPGDKSVYSDLGFMLLEWVVEETTGFSMDRMLEETFYKPLGLKMTFLGGTQALPHFDKGRFAATEDCPWRKRVIQGEVHDENAFALGGFSGHAGLFGTAADTYATVLVLKSILEKRRTDFLKTETVKTFFERQSLVGGCTWALGWDTPARKGSSSGKYFSQNSVGHLGFTGTSVWMDLEKDVTVIFLTNRVHPTRKNVKIRAFRPRLHDLILETLGMAG